MGKLKLNHGWLMLTTDMPDTHTLLPTLTLMPPHTAHTDISSARDPPMLKPKLSQKPGTVLTVMLELMPHTAMDIVMLLHTPGDTESKLVKKKIINTFQTFCTSNKNYFY